jgi:ABC-type transporter Mla MlaB component
VTPRLQPEPSTAVLLIDGPVAAADVPRLCERLRALLRASDLDIVVCDAGTLAADAATIEALARLQLTARRLGRRIRLQRVPCELGRLLAFVGLDEVLAAGPQRDRDDAPP